MTAAAGNYDRVNMAQALQTVVVEIKIEKGI